MRVVANTADRGPMFLIEDQPDDDDWIDITEHSDLGQRFFGKRTGDLIEVVLRDGIPVAKRTAGTAQEPPSAEVLDLMAELKASLSRRGGH